MNEGVIARRPTYGAVFMVTLATLMYEILLTRIFSVTMWYHFAFMAISIALFGMTFGAILLYLFPQYFTLERAKHHLAPSSLLFAVSVVFSLLSHLSIPFGISKSPLQGISITWLYATALKEGSTSRSFAPLCVYCRYRIGLHVGRDFTDAETERLSRPPHLRFVS